MEEKINGSPNGSAKRTLNYQTHPVNHEPSLRPRPSGIVSFAPIRDHSQPAQHPTASSKSPNLSRTTVRALPPWVAAATDENEQESSLLPDPTLTVPPLAHRSSSSNQRPTGRVQDPYREQSTPIPHALTEPEISRWRLFVESSAYAKISPAGAEKVDQHWLQSHPHDLAVAWLDGDAELEPGLHAARQHRGRRQLFLQRLQIRLFRSPFVPLIFRTFVWTFSLAALVITGQILRHPQATDLGLGPATVLAVVVEAVAVVYVIYITYDEYKSKPLGLRSPIAAARLILLDLLFIIFNSALLSLAFAALGDERGVCGDGNDEPTDGGLCGKQKALAGVFFIGLLGWLATFNISILRLVSRMSRSS